MSVEQSPDIETVATAPPKKGRIASIDWMRGIIMVLPLGATRF